MVTSRWDLLPLKDLAKAAKVAAIAKLQHVILEIARGSTDSTACSAGDRIAGAAAAAVWAAASRGAGAFSATLWPTRVGSCAGAGPAAGFCFGAGVVTFGVSATPMWPGVVSEAGLHCLTKFKLCLLCERLLMRRTSCSSPALSSVSGGRETAGTCSVSDGHEPWRPPRAPLLVVLRITSDMPQVHCTLTPSPILVGSCNLRLAPPSHLAFSCFAASAGCTTILNSTSSDAAVIGRATDVQLGKVFAVVMHGAAFRVSQVPNSGTDPTTNTASPGVVTAHSTLNTTCTLPVA